LEAGEQLKPDERKRGGRNASQCPPISEMYPKTSKLISEHIY